MANTPVPGWPGASSRRPSGAAAMIACKECGGLVSENEVACPYCGRSPGRGNRSLTGEMSQERKTQALGCLVLAPILIVVGWFWLSSNPAWPKSAGNTTCAEWVGQMTSDQRGVMADAMIEILWQQDAAANKPNSAVHAAFGNAIGPACTTYPSEKLSTVAAAVYMTTPAVRP